jgi:uncharacterized protein
MALASMAINSVLVDTGPIVALLSARDANHATCVAQAQLLPRPLWTTWPVVTECAWLLRHVHDGVSDLLKLVEQSVIVPLDLGVDAAAWMNAFTSRYESLRPQLADASLCYLCSRHDWNTIFTLDRRDFTVFRRENSTPFRLLPDE